MRHSCYLADYVNNVVETNNCNLYSGVCVNTVVVQIPDKSVHREDAREIHLFTDICGLRL